MRTLQSSRLIMGLKPLNPRGERAIKGGTSGALKASFGQAILSVDQISDMAADIAEALQVTRRKSMLFS